MIWHTRHNFCATSQRHVVIALVLAMLCVPVCGQTSTDKPETGDIRVYTLDECLEIGLARATPLANARRDEGIANAYIRQARAEVLPQVSLSGNYSRLDEVAKATLEDQTFEMGNLNNYTASLGVSQLLYSGGRVLAAIRATEFSRQYAKEAITHTESRLIRDIKTGFYNVLLAKDVIRVHRESVEHLNALVKQTELKNLHKVLSEFDLLSARVRLANERPQLIVASNRLEIAKETFRNLVNLDDVPFDLAGELDKRSYDIDLESAIQAGMANRSDLRQMQARVHILEQNVVATRAEYFPSLRATAAYAASNPDPLAPFDAGTEWGYHWNAGLVLEWDILDGGLRGGKILEARLTVAKEQANMKETKKRIRLEVTEGYLDMTHALEAIKGSKENMALAEKALSIAKTRYEQGLSTYLEYTETNLALSTAQLTHFQALHAHLCAIARLCYACGLTDEQRE